MLREATKIHTVDGQVRRWFYDTSFDLILWLTPDEITLEGFELCYTQVNSETAVRWNHAEGFSTFGLNSEGGHGKHKATTVLTQRQDPPLLDASALAKFQVASLTLDAPLRNFILAKLEELRI
ncbi:hypothetical protein [Prochlorothrix hollandica]|nr:hypothetical protein [Prochlorothrix hollandica]